jgi:hypothetical protein
MAAALVVGRAARHVAVELMESAHYHTVSVWSRESGQHTIACLTSSSLPCRSFCWLRPPSLQADCGRFEAPQPVAASNRRDASRRESDHEDAMGTPCPVAWLWPSSTPRTAAQMGSHPAARLGRRRGGILLRGSTALHLARVLPLSHIRDADPCYQSSSPDAYLPQV